MLIFTFDCYSFCTFPIQLKKKQWKKKSKSVHLGNPHYEIGMYVFVKSIINICLCLSVLFSACWELARFNDESLWSFNNYWLRAQLRCGLLPMCAPNGMSDTILIGWIWNIFYAIDTFHSFYPIFICWTNFTFKQYLFR